jgi:predicted TIM-barrel fold metal-dependent hydrolase
LRGFKLKENATAEIMEAVAELRVPLIYHPPTVPQFIDFARAYPRVDMILAHLGGVTYSRRPESHVEAIEAAKALANVFLDTSTVLETRYLERAVREVPIEKIIFGSDAPDCDCRLEIFKVRMLKLPRHQEEMVLGGNLQRLLAKARS